MVVVKVRETYDLATVRSKMTVIAVHTPKPALIKENFPGLLMQCKAYRPLKASVRIACASQLPLDPQGVGLTEDDVAPEDMFNPILYKAMSNVGLSQLEARIMALSDNQVDEADIVGATSSIDVDSNTDMADEFPIYYGLLSNAHGWKHAHPQQGLMMSGLRPLVYEMMYNIGDNASIDGGGMSLIAPDESGNADSIVVRTIRGNPKPLPFINCTYYTFNNPSKEGEKAPTGYALAGFPVSSGAEYNCEVGVPYINCCVAGIIIPPSRLHQLFYRMVVEWDVEFSAIRPLAEVMNYSGLRDLGNATHYKNYDYSNVKKALTGSDESKLVNDACMVSANVDVKKVM